MNKFIEYILSLQPDFLEKVEGATPEEIEALESLVGFPLPQQYKDFLLLMGRKHPESPSWYGKEKTNINTIREFYEITIDEGEPIPEDYVVLTYANYAYDLCVLTGDAENNVMLLDGEKIVGYEARSLETMLLKWAFSEYELLSLPHYRSYSDGRLERRLPMAEDIVKRLGFQILWFSDAVRIYAKKDNAAISVSQSRPEDRISTFGGGITVYVGANSKEEAKRIGDVFESELKTNLVKVDDRFYR